jgi:TfoX/Sxy family transcriptional regulator of competence genes
MATSPSTIDLLLSQLGEESGVSARKMFGEYGLFLDGKMVALVCDDILYLKPTTSGLAYLGDHEDAPPYPGAKPCAIVPERFLRRSGALEELLRRTWKELPVPRPKPASKPKKPGTR